MSTFLMVLAMADAGLSALLVFLLAWPDPIPGAVMLAVGGSAAVTGAMLAFLLRAGLVVYRKGD